MFILWPMKKSSIRLAMLMTLLSGAMSSVAIAAPCGDVALEGRCDGTTRQYCNAGELQSEECATCCGWDGDRYDCLGSCPEDGSCIEECLEGVDVFGCSLMNTHEWTCSIGAEGCTVRTFVACGEGQICDESSSNACRPVSEVDLCSGISSEGECKGGIFKQCVNGQLVNTDCALLGQECTAVGCADCTNQCKLDEVGCESTGKAWTCVPSAFTGCLERAAKNCSGGKVCYEGKCMYADEIPRIAEPEVSELNEVEPVETPVPEEVAATSCQTSGFAPDTTRDGFLAVISTILGFLFFMRFARRRD